MCCWNAGRSTVVLGANSSFLVLVSFFFLRVILDWITVYLVRPGVHRITIKRVLACVYYIYIYGFQKNTNE